MLFRSAALRALGLALCLSLFGTVSGACGQGALGVMPGVVKEVRVKAGDRVAAHAPLLVLEAMKMENEVRADRDATVTKVHVSPGQAVEKGAPLVTLAE